MDDGGDRFMAGAVYSGCFDMFTKGHLDIIDQAIKIFDRIIIVVQNNPMKKRAYTVESCKEFIEQAIAQSCYDDVVSVDVSDVPASLYAEKHSCEFVIRGLRNTSDYLYEEKIADFYKAVCPSVDLVYFKSRFDNISSSLVKGLLYSGINKRYVEHDYLPANISILKRCDAE
jgi:pantetheine-phosphate adenylyltransferase